MSEIKVKVCGMCETENIQKVSQLKPDYMGFIFYRDSPRFVGADFKMPPMDVTIKKVGVFVNEPMQAMTEAYKKYTLDYLQLHGNESIEICSRLKSQGMSIIKVFSMSDDFDFAVTKPYMDRVDFFLFDTKGKYYGGNAKTFNWSILQKYDQEKPFFLSGGLSSYNIQGIDRLSGMNLHAIDLNSGVEIRRGLKDVNKIQDVQSILNSVI